MSRPVAFGSSAAVRKVKPDLKDLVRTYAYPVIILDFSGSNFAPTFSINAMFVHISL